MIALLCIACICHIGRLSVKVRHAAQVGPRLPGVKPSARPDDLVGVDWSVGPVADRPAGVDGLFARQAEQVLERELAQAVQHLGNL